MPDPKKGCNKYFLNELKKDKPERGHEKTSFNSAELTPPPMRTEVSGNLFRGFDFP